MNRDTPLSARTRQAAPQSGIVHGRLHAFTPLKESLDQICRRKESAKPGDEGDDTLKPTRFLWLHGQTPDSQRKRSEELLETT